MPGYMLEDRNGDGVIDFVNVELVLGADPSPFVVAAASDIATRLAAVARDREIMHTIRELEARHDRLLDSRPWSPELEDLTWSLQELRVSLFAQSVGAKGKVSVKRVRSALELVERD